MIELRYAPRHEFSRVLALDTDATNGLQMKVDVCSNAWTESGASPNFTYTCSGTQQSALVQQRIIGTKMSLSNVALGAGATNHFLFTFTLPTTSPSSMQGATSTITYQFDAGARAAGPQ